MRPWRIDRFDVNNLSVTEPFRDHLVISFIVVHQVSLIIRRDKTWNL